MAEHAPDPIVDHFVRERLGMSLAAVQAKMAVGLLARVSGEAGWLAPPDEDTLAEVQRLESSVLAGESDVQMSRCPDVCGAGADGTGAPAPGLGHATLR